eukprot:15252203-Heterocapsa_arctica.AAC.1
MKAEVCTSSTERMRPDAVVEQNQDLEDMHLEEQNEIMGEQIARPRATAAQMATRLWATGSSNKTALRY